MGDEETRICSNCKRDIPSVNYLVHSVHCARNIRACPVCKEPVLLADLEEHHNNFHQLKPCKKCGENVCGSDLEDHVRDSCSLTIQPCRFCELELPRRDIPAHEAYCGARTERCGDCGEYVMLKYRQLHEESNHGFIQLDDEPVTLFPKLEFPKLNNYGRPSASNGASASSSRPTPANGQASSTSQAKYLKPVANTSSSNAENAERPATHRLAIDQNSKAWDILTEPPPVRTKNTNINRLQSTHNRPHSSHNRPHSSQNRPHNSQNRPESQNRPQSARNTLESTQNRRELNYNRPESSHNIAESTHNRPESSYVRPEYTGSTSQGASSLPKRTNDRPQVNTAVAATSKVNNEGTSSRGTKKRTAPRPPPSEPPVPAPRDPHNDSSQDLVWGPTADFMAGLHGAPRGARGGGGGSGSGAGGGEGGGDGRFGNLEPMTHDEFMNRFQRLQFESDSRPRGSRTPHDRINEIKSSLQVLRRGLGEVTAPYNQQGQARRPCCNSGRNCRCNAPRQPGLDNAVDDQLGNLSGDLLGNLSGFDLEGEVELPCEFCGELIHHEQLVLHQTGCRPDLVGQHGAAAAGAEPLIPCEFCAEPQPLYLITEHQERCQRENSPLYAD